MTVDGKRVIKGGFKLVNEAGIPMEMLLETLKEQNLVLDWEDFCREALNAEWRIKTIISKMEEAILDIYGPTERPEFMLRLKLMLGKVAMELLNDD